MGKGGKGKHLRNQKKKDAKVAYGSTSDYAEMYAWVVCDMRTLIIAGTSQDSLRGAKEKFMAPIYLTVRTQHGSIQATSSFRAQLTT